MTTALVVVETSETKPVDTSGHNSPYYNESEDTGIETVVKTRPTQELSQNGISETSPENKGKYHMEANTENISTQEEEENEVEEHNNVQEKKATTLLQ